MGPGSVSSGAIEKFLLLDGAAHQQSAGARQCSTAGLPDGRNNSDVGQKRSAHQAGLNRHATAHVSAESLGAENEASWGHIQALLTVAQPPTLSFEADAHPLPQANNWRPQSTIEFGPSTDRHHIHVKDQNICGEDTQGLPGTMSVSNVASAVSSARPLFKRAAAFQAERHALPREQSLKRNAALELPALNRSLHEAEALQDTASWPPVLAPKADRSPAPNNVAALMRNLEARFDATGSLIEPQACGTDLDHQLMQTAHRLWTAAKGDESLFLSQLSIYLYAQEAFDNENVGEPGTRMPPGSEPMIWNLMLKDPAARFLLQAVVANSLSKQEQFAGTNATGFNHLNQVSTVYPADHFNVNPQATLDTIEFLRQIHQPPTAAG